MSQIIIGNFYNFFVKFTCHFVKFILHLVISNFTVMNTIAKYFGILLVVVGIPTLFLDDTAGAELPLLVGLFILFITKEKREDERAVMLKTSSAYIGLALGYGIKLISSNLYAHQIISMQLTDINHFLILILALAIVIFYSRMYIILK